MSDFQLHKDDSQVTLGLETKYAMCEDRGRYLCEVIVNNTFYAKTFNVDVKSENSIGFSTGMSDLGPNWIRLDANRTNPGPFQITFQHVCTGFQDR